MNLKTNLQTTRVLSVAALAGAALLLAACSSSGGTTSHSTASSRGHNTQKNYWTPKSSEPIADFSDKSMSELMTLTAVQPAYEGADSR